MYTEKHMKAKSITAYLIRNTGILRFVPIIMLDIFALAMIILSITSRENIDDMRTDFLMISQYIFPLFCVWWSVFILREFIEADGNEVFYSAGLTNIMVQALKPFLLLLCNCALLLALCSAFCPDFVIEFARIFSACIFCFGLIYFVSMCFKSTAIAIFAAIVYMLLCALTRYSDSVFPMFMSGNLLDRAQLLSLCLPLAVSGVLLVIIGRQIEKRFFTFN